MATIEPHIDIHTDNVVNKDRIQLWLDALRSGDYTQTYHALSREGGHCCLGVACEVAMANGLEVRKVEAAEGGHTTYDGISNLLPKSVVNWFGLPSSGPSVLMDSDDIDVNYTEELAVLNDRNHTFNQLADLIEKTYMNKEV